MASLEKCIRLAYSAVVGRPLPVHERIFDYGLSHSPPRLEQTRLNRVLVYPGSFNPPHLGHLETLVHAFHHAGLDLNDIAAFVFPHDDSLVGTKYMESGTVDPVLRQDQRARLWAGHQHFPKGWAWTFQGSGVAFDRFQNSLAEVTERDGYNINFVLLSGPDLVDPITPMPESPYRSKGFIISDFGRKAAYFPPDGRLPVPFRGWEDWRRIKRDDLDKEARIQTSALRLLCKFRMLGLKADESLE